MCAESVDTRLRKEKENDGKPRETRESLKEVTRKNAFFLVITKVIMKLNAWDDIFDNRK
jgi:hypothetical protein